MADLKLIAGENVTLTSDVPGGELTVDVLTEAVQDLIVAFLEAGDNITLTPGATLVIELVDQTEIVRDLIGTVTVGDDGVIKTIDDVGNTVTFTLDMDFLIGAILATVLPGPGIAAVGDGMANTVTISLDHSHYMNFEFPAVANGQVRDLVAPFDYEIEENTVVADASGSVSFQVDRATYAAFPTMTNIDASAPPALSSAQKSRDSTLTGWTKTGSAGDILRATASGVSGITAATMALKLLRA